MVGKIAMLCSLLVSMAAFSAAAPTVTAIQNNYSYLVPGQPNYGIAPGTLFIVKGAGLAAPGTQAHLWDLSQGPLPLSSPDTNGTSIAVAVGATTVNPGIYYITETQVAAVLPSNIPAGNGTLTVTFNGQTSAPANITVVASAVGFDTLYPLGVGEGVATDNSSGALITYTASAHWGEVVVFWGSGVGADTSNDDRTYPAKQNNLSSISALYIGGVQAQVLYQGRSQYPGVDQVDVMIPNGVQGCFVSVTAVSGTGSAQLVSNTVTLPVEQNGGNCSDSNFSLTGDQFTALSAETGPKTAVIQMNENLSPSGTIVGAASANGTFYHAAPAQYGSGYGSASYGSCFVSEAITPAHPGGGFNGGSTFLDAGTLTATGGSPSPLAMAAQETGVYTGIFANGYTFPGGQAFTVSNGNGGKDVKAFTVSVNAPATPLAWTNAPATVTRSQGVTVNWTGGDATTDVEISGSYVSTPLTVFFNCFAPQTALTFTVPPYITMSLPAGSGFLTLINGTKLQNFSLTGLDYAYAYVSETTQARVTYQ